MREGQQTDWLYSLNKNVQLVSFNTSRLRLPSAKLSHSGEYQCTGLLKADKQVKKQTNEVPLIVSDGDVILDIPSFTMFESESVTLGCRHRNPGKQTGAKFYRNGSLLKMDTTHNTGMLTINIESKSDEGFYKCKFDIPANAESPESLLKVEALPTATVSFSPKPVYNGGTLTLTCAIQSEYTDWTYRWFRGETPTEVTSSGRHDIVENTLIISELEASDQDNYWCVGERQSRPTTSKHSDKKRFAVIAKPQTVLSLSPLWLSPGDSVTLSCAVKESSEGWRFYWYRAVPKPSHNSYTYELLPGSHNGTLQGSYIIQGPTGTGGYVCRAERGDPAYYTLASQPQFVWSGDLHSSASLTVSSNRTQHFISESVSLSCEGNSTEWKVKGFTSKRGSSWSQCLSSSVSVTRYTCNVPSFKPKSGVFWCESGMGEYSNAVNITVHNGSVILVSPVHPVTEGRSVALHCKHRTDPSLSNVDFYRNEELVQTKSTGEMIIPAVSKSDEGFYKCKYSGGESPRSWVAVTVMVTQPSVPGPMEPISPLIVALIVGPLVVILLTIVLVLLCRYRSSKDRCCASPVQTNHQDSATDQRTNQSAAPDDVYYSLQHGDSSIYGVIQHSDDYENGDTSVNEVIQHSDDNYEDVGIPGTAAAVVSTNSPSGINEDVWCVRPVQSHGIVQHSAAEEEANQSGAPDDVYCPLLHRNTSIYEVITQSNDYENDGMGIELGERQNSGNQLRESQGRNEST